MPGRKEQHKNWIRSHSDNVVDVLRRGSNVSASFNGKDHSVVIIPVLPDGSLVLGETYRAIIDEISIEFPSCYVAEGADHNKVARELSNIHSNIDPSDVVYLGTIHPAPDLLDLTSHIYLTRLSEPSIGRFTPPNGMLSLRAMSIQEISEIIAKGGLTDGLTISALTKYLTQNRADQGLLPTRLRDIEILDRSGQILCKAKTNQPEWSFLQYQEDHGAHVYDWRFAEDDQPFSPRGEPLQRKSSAAGPARDHVLSTPAPVFNSAATSRPSASAGVPYAGQGSEINEFSHQNTSHSPAQGDIKEDALVYLPQAAAENDIDLVFHDSSPETSLVSEAIPVEEDDPSGEISRDYNIANRPEAHKTPRTSETRRLNLSLPGARHIEDNAEKKPTNWGRTATLDNAGFASDAAKNTTDMTSVKTDSIVTATSEPVEQLSTHQYAPVHPVEDSLDERPAPAFLAASVSDKKPGELRAPVDLRRSQEEADGSLSKLTGFLKKAIQKQKDEPKSMFDTQQEQAQRPHKIYGIDDAFEDTQPPGPAYNPNQVGDLNRPS